MTSSKQPLRGQPVVKGFFEKRTFSIQYIVADPDTKRAAIIDPVLDFDPKSGSTATHSADEMLECIEREGFTLEWILDTHPHADHLGGRLPQGQDGRADRHRREGRGSPEALEGAYNYPDSFRADGSQWDHSSGTASASLSATWMSRCCLRRATPRPRSRT